MTRYAAAIFDLDGTLIGTERILIDTCIQTLASYGHVVTRDFVTSMVGVSEAEGFERICTHIGMRLDPVEFGETWSRANQVAYAKGIPLMPGVEVLLADLKARHIPHAVATNSSTAGALRKLGLSGLGQAFEHVVGFDAVATPKPAPDVFLAAADRLGVDPADCLAFEDSDPGVIAALAAGMTVVHVPDMAAPRQSGAQFMASSILEGARLAGLLV